MPIPVLLAASLPAARIAGGAILMGAGFCGGHYMVQRMIRWSEAPQPATRAQQAQSLKVSVVNLAAANRKLEEVMQDPTILAALTAIDRAILPVAPSEQPLRAAA